MDVPASQGAAGQDDAAARRGVKIVVLDTDVLTVKMQNVLIKKKKMTSFKLKGKAIIAIIMNKWVYTYNISFIDT